MFGGPEEHERRVKYDDASYHVGTAPSEAHAAAHIGLYFRWCISAGLVSSEHWSDSELSVDLEKVRAGTLSGTKYIWETNSGKLADIDLTQEGNAFTRWFYGRRYFKELQAVTGMKDYACTEQDVNFGTLQQRLDAALDAWRRSPPPKAWWRIWR